MSCAWWTLNINDVFGIVLCCMVKPSTSRLLFVAWYLICMCGILFLMSVASPPLVLFSLFAK